MWHSSHLTVRPCNQLTPLVTCALCFAFSWLIKRAAGLERAADRPGHEVIGAITLKHLYEIAAVKRRDTPNIPMEAICKNLMASCKSMGVKVVKSWEEQ